jgi:hypothetical protein
VDTRSWCLGLADKLNCAERIVPDSCSMSWADKKEDESLHLLVKCWLLALDGSQSWRLGAAQVLEDDDFEDCWLMMACQG